jgi:CRP-like cAMP-binding protein
VDYGIVNASLNGKVVQTLGSGEIFGEMTFMATCRKLLGLDPPSNVGAKDWSIVLRSCDIVTGQDCRCMELCVQDFLTVMHATITCADRIYTVPKCPNDLFLLATRHNLRGSLLATVARKVTERNGGRF